MSEDYDPFRGVSPRQKRLAWEATRRMAERLGEAIRNGESVFVVSSVCGGVMNGCVCFPEDHKPEDLTDWSIAGKQAEETHGPHGYQSWNEFSDDFPDFT